MIRDTLICLIQVTIGTILMLLCALITSEYALEWYWYAVIVTPMTMLFYWYIAYWDVYHRTAIFHHRKKQP